MGVKSGRPARGFWPLTNQVPTIDVNRSWALRVDRSNIDECALMLITLISFFRSTAYRHKTENVRDGRRDAWHRQPVFESILSNRIGGSGDRESIRSPANIRYINGPGTSIRPATRTASTHLWNLHDANRFDLPLSTFSTAFKTRHEGDTTIVYVIRSARARPLWRPEPEAGHRSQHRKSLCMPN